MNGSSEGFRVTPRLIIGLAIFAFGVLWMLDNLAYLDASQYLRYWPIVLVFIGASKLTDRRTPKFGPVLLIVIGASLLLARVTHFRFDLGDLIPLGIAVLGVKLVLDAVGRKRVASGIEDPNAVVHAFAMMAGIHHQSTSQAFRGGDVNAIMGGVELDLRGAQMKDGEEAVIDAFALWGGVEITVPENWRVAGQVMPLLGGFENKARSNAAGPLLIVRGTAVMGAVEVKN
jgi:predicted membrane protein